MSSKKVGGALSALIKFNFIKELFCSQYIYPIYKSRARGDGAGGDMYSSIVYTAELFYPVKQVKIF